LFAVLAVEGKAVKSALLFFQDEGKRVPIFFKLKTSGNVGLLFLFYKRE